MIASRIRIFFILFCALISVSSYAQTKVVVIPLGGEALPLQNVITVSRENGDFADPVEAMKSITDADENNRYLVVIGPGVFTLTETLDMQPYVDISGSGRHATLLTGAISQSTEPIDDTSAIVQGASNASLQNLSIENTGTGKISSGIYSSASPGSSASPVLSHLNISVVGGNSTYGILNYSASPEISNVSITSSGTFRSRGVVNNDSSMPRMSDMKIIASGGTNCVGVINNTASSPLMSQIEIDVSAATDAVTGIWNIGASEPRISETKIVASGVYKNHGIYNENASPTVTNAEIYVSGGSFSNFAVFNIGTSRPTISDSKIIGTGSPSHGVWNWGTGPSALIRNCAISGESISVVAGTGSGATETLISNSILVGGTTGDPLCSFTFDGAGNELSAVYCNP